MKKKFLLLSLLVIFFLVLGSGVKAISITDWRTYESDNFIVFYPSGYEYQAQDTLYYLEKYRPQIIELTGNQLDKKIHVVVEDTGLYTNGYANPVNNKIGIFTNQPESYSTLAGYENWYRLVNIHELTHIAQMNNTSGLSSLNTSIFGNLFSPNLHTPLWLIEGIAVYNESQTSPYEGRLNAGYYDGVLSNRASVDEMPSLAEITYSHNHFPAGQQYLYGGAFFRYLAEQYGEAKFAQLFTEHGSYSWSAFIGNLYPTLGLDRAAKEVYGKDILELYTQWQEYEIERNQDWQLVGDQLVDTKRGYLGNLTATDDKLYYFKSTRLSSAPLNYRSINQLVEYDLANKEEEVIIESLGSNFGTIQLKDNKLYYLLGENRSDYPNVNFQGRGLVTKLYAYDLETKEQVEILTGEIKDFVVLENKEIIYAKNNRREHGSKIFSYQDGEKELLWTITDLIAELQTYQDQIIMVSKGNLSSWGISYLDPFAKRIEPLVMTSWPEKNIDIRGDKLYYTANYDGYEAVYSYDLLTEDVAKLTTGGFATSGTQVADKLYYLTYQTEGMSIYQAEIEQKEYQLPEADFDRNRPELNFAEIGVEVEEGGAIAKNFSYLMRPNMRLLPTFLAGEDALGVNQYRLDYSPYGGLDFHWTNRMINPLSITLSNIQLSEQRSTRLNLDYPLYQSRLEGLSRISLGLKSNFDWVRPRISTSFRYPRQDLGLYLEADIRGDAYNSGFQYRYLLEEGRLSFAGTALEGIRKQERRREMIDHADYYSGNKLSLDYTHKLFELRRGSWNPNLFVGDVYGNAFIDQLSYDHDQQLSGGYELLFETGAANWLHFVTKLGLATDGSDYQPYLGIDANF